MPQNNQLTKPCHLLTQRDPYSREAIKIPIEVTAEGIAAPRVTTIEATTAVTEVTTTTIATTLKIQKTTTMTKKMRVVK